MPSTVRSGEWRGLRIDPGDHQVTHVLLAEGHLWGREEVAIPASAVTKVENGIWLNLTKKQVEALPPPTEGPAVDTAATRIRGLCR